MEQAILQDTLYLTTKGVLGLGGLDPLKIGGVRVCFDPLKCHLLSFKTVVG